MFLPIVILTGSVATNDQRNITLWIILAVAALVLCGVMCIFSKFSGKK
jgi:Ni/Fe-hydrogenase subunit HybB-like protein